MGIKRITEDKLLNILARIIFMLGAFVSVGIVIALVWIITIWIIEMRGG